MISFNRIFILLSVVCGIACGIGFGFFFYTTVLKPDDFVRKFVAPVTSLTAPLAEICGTLSGFDVQQNTIIIDSVYAVGIPQNLKQYRIHIDATTQLRLDEQYYGLIAGAVPNEYYTNKLRVGDRLCARVFREVGAFRAQSLTR